MSSWFHQIRDYFAQGGFVMWPLAIGALVLWYSLGYRLLTLRRGSVRGPQGLIRRIRRGRRGSTRGIIDTAVTRGMALLPGRPRHLKGQLDEAFFDLHAELKRYHVLAQAVVVVAPLAGLLGTVTGMIETFDALGDRTLFSQSGGIAGGISQALISTQMGLAVAIPGLVVGRILTRKQRKLETELDAVKDALCLEAASLREARA